MAQRSFQLTARGVEQASATETHDFTFVVGEIEYVCCRFQACFFSKAVYRAVMADRATDRYFLKVPDPSNHFPTIMKLINGDQIEITPSNVYFLELCARELENDELLAFIANSKLQTAVDMSTVLERIYIKRESKQDFSDELKYIASHFHRVDVAFAMKLTIDELDQILSNDALQLRSEDELFFLISELVSKRGRSYAILFHHVQFQFLEEDNLHSFLDQVFPDSLDISLWNVVRECLEVFCRLSDKNSMLKAERYPAYLCENGSFNGIISYLRAKHGGNVHSTGAVEITASSNDYNECHYTVDYGWNDYWASYGHNKAYLQFDFKQSRVCVTGYTLKSDGSEYGHLVSWVLEASDDGSPGSWEVIDARSTEDLVGQFVVKTYHCNQPSNKLKRFVRLRQTGRNSQGDNDFRLSEIEFFGRLNEST